ncbi:MAG: O-antigen ligase domain-containing protein [Scytonema sp. PMC 1069.18]|nr:O-antigen ligase domain-containing protein [Scytonema sp. PMC 1069.18]MEC4881993.1 O-antigen ligase domain-containing protein [Scytonema sp. PMC 1070.18]
MAHIQTHHTTPTKGVSFGFQPPLAWAAILSLVFFTTVCLLAGAAGILRTAYIGLSFAVGLLLYARYPVLYISFTWWMWFVTPFISRLVDLKSGWDPSRLMLVSQYLVTLLTVHTLIKHLPRSLREGGLPFLLATLGVFYGTMIGLVKTSPMTAARGVLDWLSPIAFAFYLFIHWRNYPQYRQNIQSTFLWGVLVMGIYGAIQFLVAPEWDRFWLISTKLTSMGDPEPLMLRVWSTMASPAPFAAIMMAGLVLLFSSQDFLRIPASAAGYLAFLLTTVRTLWGAWVVAFLTMVTSLKPRLQMRLVVTILVMAICVVPLMTIKEFSDPIMTRFESFGNLENDDSAKVRQKIYEEGLSRALSNGLGNGVGNTFIVNDKGILVPLVIDSGFLDTFFTLGWFGAVFYLSGMLLLVMKVFQSAEARSDSFVAAARSIGLGMISTLAGNSGMLAIAGMVLWGFLGIALAGQNYHKQQRISQMNEAILNSIPPRHI